MHVYDVHNPVLVADTLRNRFIRMGDVELNKTIEDSIRRAEEFMRAGDEAFSKSLGQEEATLYASHVRSFLQAVDQLKRGSGLKIIRANDLAQVIALWQTISVFKTMHERP